MTLHDGLAGAERVRRICDRARLALALGWERLNLDPCHCTYPDGRKRFVNPEGKPVHVCGR